MYRIICLVIGYICGNFLTAAVVAKAVSGKSIFEQGTGNPGMANVTRLFGVKRGALVLAGDLGKTFIACLLCRLILFPHEGCTAAAYACLGVVLGHNFPVWHKFKGGKGVTCTCAGIFCISYLFGLIACIIGGIVVLISHSLSVSAVVIPGVFIIPSFLFFAWEIICIVLALTAIMIFRHFSDYGEKPEPGR